MRESFGGAFIIKLLLIFIVIYISFMAVAINYAKAFRVKNQVINMIEQLQYNGKDADVRYKIDDYLASIPYNVNGNEGVKNYCNGVNFDTFSDGYALTLYGACIQTLGEEGKHYYKVTTFITIDFPFFNIHMTLPVSGETKVIVY